jgi:hypothetical protein
MKPKPLMSPSQKTLRGALGMAACIATLTGCSVGPDFLRPDNVLDKVQLQPRSDYTSPYPTSVNAVPASWWTLFNDPVLAELEEKAFAANRPQIVSPQVEQSCPTRYHCFELCPVSGV